MKGKKDLKEIEAVKPIEVKVSEKDVVKKQLKEIERKLNSNKGSRNILLQEQTKLQKKLKQL